MDRMMESSWADDAWTSTSIDRTYPRSPPMSPPGSANRFIVEPQVLNAAFESELGGKPGPAASLHPSGGGLPPPPRPNSRKEKPPRSAPPSPATSLNNSVASLPTSPNSSPYSNGPNTPGSSNPTSPNVRPTPRLSNLLRGESLVFSSRRLSLVEHDTLYDHKERDEETRAPAHETGDRHSPFDSVPSSPEQPTTPADGSRPSRQNRYLSGLQKIKNLGKAKGSLSILAESGARTSRRLSDVDVDSRHGKHSAQRQMLFGTNLGQYPEITHTFPPNYPQQDRIVGGTNSPGAYSRLVRRYLKQFEAASQVQVNGQWCFLGAFGTAILQATLLLRSWDDYHHFRKCHARASHNSHD
ncbi:hypothetical protein C8Q78DRAFT_989769 [Trametes maxima]|nr:hypothetical protein C8Q78DRAFT_989769 [Trametes maxima]